MSKNITKSSVLVVNDGNYPLLIDLVPVLVRAGLEIDLVSSGRMLSHSKFIRQFYFEKDKNLIPKLLKKLIDQKEYTLVVITTDALLKMISGADLDENTKLKLLPVMSVNDMPDLYSKVALSKKFEQMGVNTPSFEVIESKPYEKMYETHLNFPVLVKIDSSGAGLGVFECVDQLELSDTIAKIDSYPVLIQEKLNGDSLDASAIYHQGHLIYFSLSKIEKEMYQFGPSSLRKYYDREKYTSTIIHELKTIGKIYKIHGFTNISLINSNGKNYYFEVDIRPNAWINHGCFIGHDCADVLQKYFVEHKTAYSDEFLVPNLIREALLPHYLRISLFELMANQHGVWSLIPKNGWYYIFYRQIKMLKRKIKRNKYSFYPYSQTNPSPYG